MTTNAMTRRTALTPQAMPAPTAAEKAPAVEIRMVFSTNDDWFSTSRAMMVRNLSKFLSNWEFRKRSSPERRKNGAESPVRIVIGIVPSASET